MNSQNHERPDGVAGQWENEQTLNIFQRVASWSHGWLTAANLVSIAGAASTTAGLYHVARGEYSTGLGLIAIGRGADIADGYVAEWTKTKGEKGALIDASLDKALTVGAAAVLVYTEPISAVATLPLLVTQAGIAVENKRIHQNNGKPTPSKLGKYAMFEMWAATASLVTYKAFESSGQSTLTTIFAGVSGAIYSMALIDSYKAWREYRNQRKRLEKARQ